MKKLSLLLAATLATLSTTGYGGDADELTRAIASRKSAIFCGPPLGFQQVPAVFLCTDAKPSNVGPETTLWLAVQARFNL